MRPTPCGRSRRNGADWLCARAWKTVTKARGLSSRSRMPASASGRTGRRACSRRSTRRSRTDWAWGCPSAARSWTGTGDVCGRRRTRATAPPFTSLCRGYDDVGCGRGRNGRLEVAAMTTEMRKSGIDVVGDMPWGTHVCLFYETKEDLLDTLASYCRAGLESQEFCLWVVAEPVREEEARRALKQVVPDLDRYLADHSIDIVSAGDWYLQGGTFDLKRVMSGWHERLALALARGYAGVRVTGDTAWLEKKDWKDFCEYEETLNESIANQRLAVLCTYPLAACGAAEILDVARTHQFALAKRHGSWEVLETPALKQAKAEMTRLNEELEQRVLERTSQLTAVNEELRKEILERKRAEEALRQQANLLEQAHDAIIVWDFPGTIIYWNRGAQQLYGFPKDEAVGRITHDLLQTEHPMPT